MTSFDRSTADGTRRSVGIVGVDSGTMCIATGRFPDKYSDCFHQAAASDGYAVSSSGYGDGGYDLVVVEGSDGTARGVEVVFISTAIEAFVEEAAEAELGPGPSEDELHAFYRHTLADESARRRIATHLDSLRDITGRVWEEKLAGLHPADDTVAQVLGELEVNGPVGVGDPCYGGPSKTLTLPPGRYVAVAWGTGTIARLGLYAVTPPRPLSEGMIRVRLATTAIVELDVPVAEYPELVGLAGSGNSVSLAGRCQDLADPLGRAVAANERSKTEVQAQVLAANIAPTQV